MPPNATYRVSGYCHGGRDQAAALIFNGEADVKRTFVVHNFLFREAAPTPTTATLWNVYKTTAQSGGEAVQTDPMDSTNSALPSQVSIATNPEITQGDYLYGRWIAPTNVTTIGTPAVGGFGPGTAWVRSDTSALMDSRGFSDTQTIVLREGEGIAFINPSSSDSPNPVLWQVQAIVRAGTSVYTITSSMSPCISLAGLGFFNGTGSGVVLEIMALSLMNTGLPTITTITNDAPVVRMARVFGYDGGAPMTPVSLGGAPVPSQLVVLRNQDWKPLNIATALLDGNNGINLVDLGVPGTTIIGLTQQRQIGVMRHFLPYTNNLMSLSLATTGVFGTSFKATGANGIFYQGANQSISRIRLNPGEGLALIVDNYTINANYWFEAEITHEPPQVVGPSPMGYTS